MKISVIVPVYNAKNYIRECLDGLMAQTLPPEELEILAVDDCSTDGSREILEEYAGRCPQLRVFSTGQNSGPGGARNVGLSEAQGEYLGFVDSDDAVVSTMYEHMYETAKTGDLDIVDSGIYYQAQDLAMVHTADEDTGEQDDEKRSHNIVSGGYLMTRIYRRSFWERLELRFREGVTLEDMESLMYLSACAGRVGNLKEICYIYRDTADSASKVTAYEAYQKNARAAMEAAYRLLCPLPCYAGIQDAVEYTIAQLYVYALTNCLMQKGIRGDGELLQRQRELRDLAGKYIKKGYGNPYIQNKLEPEDIRLLQENDRDPLRLLGMVNPAQGETNG